MARGDVVDVIVQEVDKARGRIGLKLVAKHEDGSLVQPEELIERAKDAPPRLRRRSARAATAIAAAAARAATRAPTAGAARAAPASHLDEEAGLEHPAQELGRTRQRLLAERGDDRLMGGARPVECPQQPQRRLVHLGAKPEPLLERERRAHHRPALTRRDDLLEARSRRDGEPSGEQGLCAGDGEIDPGEHPQQVIRRGLERPRRQTRAA